MGKTIDELITEYTNQLIAYCTTPMTAQERNESRARCEAARSAIAEMSPRWIPVGERVPEIPSDDVLIRTIGGRSVGYLSTKGWLINGRLSDLTVTHWMPMPEPPEAPHV